MPAPAARDGAIISRISIRSSAFGPFSSPYAAAGIPAGGMPTTRRPVSDDELDRLPAADLDESTTLS